MRDPAATVPGAGAPAPTPQGVGSRPAARGVVTLRHLSGHADYEACVELQRVTWGRQFQELVPSSVLKISQRVGGVAAGAFAADGRLLGFVVGLTGVRPRPTPGADAADAADAAGLPSPPERVEIVHWSHMLAVAPESRDLGLGTRLKRFQRDFLLPLGVEVVEWTYDPLEARNAHLNLNRLGAEVAEYVEDMYAGEMGSDLAQGIGTDRFIVAWRIGGERVRAALAGERSAGADRFATAPVVNPGGPWIEEAIVTAAPPGAAAAVRIEVPADIQAFKRERPVDAVSYRQGTRRAFAAYLGHGYRVTAFFPDSDPAAARCYYGLEAAAGP
ncbi:MAG TPA: hypothetical protein VHR45_19730 [Thermoanaerobaculia bacterium]|nr:hypothetical protein [Thermoanaerobaculia bacterium]